ncbi:cell division protein FtsZ [Saccharicrinis sp. FJH54]|uniref:cell division protein FtsZ n=1 Tax=Saccharicrinis sp. FJH54 TaxID=3344665 RepID=UPI0035D4448D
MDEILEIGLPKQRPSIIKVVGVGGGGSNAVNYMFHQGIRDVEFMVCNTDAQALDNSPVPQKIQLGETLTSGLGAGSKPDIGREAARESVREIEEALGGATKMVFITAGMGGGTGTGAAPVIAEIAKDLGLLTVAIVTIPFLFEGAKRVTQALDGVEEIQKHVDALLVISNQKLREIYGDLKLSNAFSKADDVLLTATKGIAEIITLPGYVNVDFADVQTVMKNSGIAIMGMGSASGDDRAYKAIEHALISPLLNNNDITGSKDILLNITSGNVEITMDEVGQITDYIQEKVGLEASIIWGTGNDESLGDAVSVSIIATGFTEKSIPELVEKQKSRVRKFNLEEEDAEPEPGKDDDDVPRLEFGKVETDEKPLKEVDFTKKETDDKARYELFYGNKQNNAGYEVVSPSVKRHPIGLKNSLSADDLENDKLIDMMENIPAYQRSNMKLSGNEPEEVSRFTINENGDGISLNEDNSFLNNQVD